MIAHIGRYLACFAFAAIADVFWVLWSNSTKGKGWRAAMKAGNYAVLLAIPAMFNTYSWLEDKHYCLPILAGMWVGTTFTVLRKGSDF